MSSSNSSPLDYKVNIGKADRKSQEAINKHYPEMKKLGEFLGKLGLIPLINENGEIRTSGNFSVRVDGGFLITITNGCK